MVTVDTVEGVVNNIYWFHFDVTNDVLYLRLVTMRKRKHDVFGEEMPEGFILLRTADEKVIGMTVVDWWKRFGQGTLAENLFPRLENQVEAWAQKIAA